MNRWYFTTVVLLLAAAAAQAHHIWIVPEKPVGPKAKVVFSDDLEPDKPELLEKVAHAKLWVRDGAGKESPLTWKKGEDSFALDVPGEGGRTVGGVCVYGVQVYDHRLRKNVEPYLLTYYPKTILGEGAAPKPWDKLALEIVPAVSGGEIRLLVLFQGKPAPNAEMRVQAPGEDREDLKTDDKGEIKFGVKKPGMYGFQTRYIEGKAGEHGGKKYGEVRHHATLVLPLGMKPVGEAKK